MSSLSGSGPIGGSAGNRPVAGKSPIAEGRCDLRKSAIRWLLAIWRQSPIWVMPADLPIKLDPAALADLELKRGIDLFAGKSEITEGCSDFREIGDSSDLPGISDLRLSKSYGSDATGAAGTSVAAVDGRHFDAAMWRTAGAAELLWRSVALALLTGIRSTSRADSVPTGSTARSCDRST